MAARKPVQEVIDSFLADNRMIAGSREGYPALSLSLNRARELAEYVGELHQKIDQLEGKVNALEDELVVAQGKLL